MNAIIALTMLASSAQNVNVVAKDCRLVVFNQSSSYEIISSPTAAAHLQLPSPVKLVNLTNPQLWDETHDGTDVWIRGKTLEAIGATSGNTIKLVDGTTINLVVKNRPQSGLCYEFIPENQVRTALNVSDELTAEKEQFAVATRAALEEKQRYVDQADKLEAAYQGALTRATQQMSLQASDAIEDFKERIHTAYAVKKTEGNPFKVTAAYDDGLFTYIRIDTTAYGAPVITKRKGGKALVVDFSFNDLSGVFTIPGLHNELAVALDDHVVVVERVN